MQSKLNVHTKLLTIKVDKNKDIQDHMTSMEDICVSLCERNDPVDPKKTPAILFGLLPEECSFLAIMADSQNMHYQSICVIWKAVVERRKGPQKALDQSSINPPLTPASMLEERLEVAIPLIA